MGKFVEFWGGTWKKYELTPTMLWVDKVREQVMENINNVTELNRAEQNLITDTSKRKSDRITNWLDPQCLMEEIKTCNKGSTISISQSYRRHQCNTNVVAIKDNIANTNNNRFKIKEKPLPNYMFEYLIQNSYWFSHQVHQRSCHGKQHMRCGTTRTNRGSSRNSRPTFYWYIHNGRSEDHFMTATRHMAMYTMTGSFYKCKGIPENDIARLIESIEK